MKTTNTALEATRLKVLELEDALGKKVKHNPLQRFYDELIGALAGIGLMCIGQAFFGLPPIVAGETLSAAQAAEVMEDVKLQAFDPKWAPKEVKKSGSATLRKPR